MEKAPEGSKQKNRKKLDKGMGSASGSTGYEKHIPRFTYDATIVLIYHMAKSTTKKILSYY